jgi:hypothetical protein
MEPNEEYVLSPIKYRRIKQKITKEEDIDIHTETITSLVLVRNKIKFYQWQTGLSKENIVVLDEKIDHFMEFFTKKYGFPENTQTVTLSFINYIKSEFVESIEMLTKTFEYLVLEINKEDIELLKFRDEILEELKKIILIL